MGKQTCQMSPETFVLFKTNQPAASPFLAAGFKRQQTRTRAGAGAEDKLSGPVACARGVLRVI